MTEPSDDVSLAAAEAPENNESRDSLGMRWAKFVAIMVVAGVLLGLLAGFSIHVVAWNTYVHLKHIHASRAEERVMQPAADDTRHEFAIRFLAGGCLGGLIGLGYVIRCLVKDEDP